MHSGSRSQSSSLPSLRELLPNPRSRSRDLELRLVSQDSTFSGVHSEYTQIRRRKVYRRDDCGFEIAQDTIEDSQGLYNADTSKHLENQQITKKSQSSGDSQIRDRAVLIERDPNSQKSCGSAPDIRKMAQSPVQSQNHSPFSQSQPPPPSELPHGYKSIDEEIAELKAQSQHSRSSLSKMNTGFAPGPASQSSPQRKTYTQSGRSPTDERLSKPRTEFRRDSESQGLHLASHFPAEIKSLPAERAVLSAVEPIDLDVKELNTEAAPPALSDEQSRFEVQEMTVPVEIPLPVRISQNEEDSPMQFSRRFSDEDGESSTTASLLFPVDLGEMEFVIPLNVIPRIRDLYVSTINYYRRHVQCLMQQPSPSRQTIEKIKQMLTRASQNTTHVDLTHESDDPSQHMVDPEDEAAWAVSNSQKFQFLQELFLALLRASKVCHFAIIARPGKLMDILEKFLQGSKVPYQRLDTRTRSKFEIQECFEVFLLPSGEEGASLTARRADLVIAFDSSFNAKDSQVKSFRTDNRYPDRLSPILYLLIHNTAEHIEHCIPRDIDEFQRLRMIVGYILSLKKEVGKRDSSDVSVKNEAQAVARYIHTEWTKREWCLPGIRPIEEIEFMEPQADPQPEEEPRVTRGSGMLKRGLVSLIICHLRE